MPQLEGANISAASGVSGRSKRADLSLSAASLEFPCLLFSVASQISHKFGLEISVCTLNFKFQEAQMAFENAIITKEDDEKYGLSALYGKYNYGAKLPNLNFTIDRQLDCCF